MNEATRIVKKYPNRRLYDTQESRYITLNDVRQLVVDGRSVTVIENKTGRNITSSVLMQVITELEDVGSPPLSEHFLTRVIRAHSHGLTRLVSDYLDTALEFAALPAASGSSEQVLDKLRGQQREIARRTASAGNGQPSELPPRVPPSLTERSWLKS